MAVGELGLVDTDLDAVDRRCRGALRREVERERERPRVGRSRLRRSVAVPLSVLILGVLGAVGYAALSGSTSSAGIECHLDDSLKGSGTITHLDGRPAIDACAQLWAQGHVNEAVRSAPATLHACVERDGGGAIHVFASRDPSICDRVGCARTSSPAPTPPSAATDHRCAGRHAVRGPRAARDRVRSPARRTSARWCAAARSRSRSGSREALGLRMDAHPWVPYTG
jgi:hypothetical protein